MQRFFARFSAVACVFAATSFFSAAGAAADDEIAIGHYGSLTGAEATFGRSTDDGIKIAVDQFNAAGGLKGKKVKLYTLDDQGRTQEAATVVERLITQNRVVALLGEVASGRSIAGGQIAQKNGVPMITPSSTNPQVTEIGDMISRVCFTDDFQGWACAKFAHDNLKLTKAATLYDRTQPYSQGLADYFEDAFKKMGGTITTRQSFGGGDNDFTAQIAKIRDTKADIVFIPGYYTDAANIAIQVRKAGLKIPMMGGDGWDSAELGKNAGDAIEGSYFSNHYAPDQPSAEVKSFVKMYKDKFGQTPDALAALGYDSARLLFDAMGRAKSLAGKDLAKAIAETKGFKGVTGAITIDEERNASKPAVIVMMKGGSPTFVTEIAPSAKK